MNKKVFRLGCFMVLCSFASLAQEKDSVQINQLNEIVVSDTKFAQSKEKSGKIIEVISSNELSQKLGQSLADVLNQVAGVEINGNQSFNGKNLSYYIRGGRNRQVVIYIDGVPVTDASGIGIEYDLRLLPVDQVAKIEIMKGASSSLYGTGAATGVINITLKKASDKSISGNAFMNFGTQNTSETNKTSAQDFNQGFSVNGTLKKFNYLTSVNHTNTNGISEAEGVNFEEDTFQRINVLQKFGIKINPKLQFDFFGNYDKIKVSFDNSYGGPNSSSDDLFNNSNSEQFRFGFLPKYKYKSGEFNLNSSFTSIERTINLFSSFTNTIDVYNYASQNINVDAFNKHLFSKEFYLVLGTQFQYFDMFQEDQYTLIEKDFAKFNTIDPYATLVYNSNFGLNINAGTRLNNHSIYGSQWVYNINPSYNISDNLKVLSSYSTAFITPSLYQLYSPYGNLALTPEENITLETGFEVSFLDKKIQLSTVGFYRNETNSIGFFYNPVTFISNYINIDGTYNAKGIEAVASYFPTSKLSLSVNYTFTETEEALNRLIPKHKANVNLNYDFTKKTSLNVAFQHVSSRNDAYFDNVTFNSESIILDGYSLLNSNLRHELLKDRLQIFTAVTNLLNENFQESIGYTARGRNFKLGFNFLF
ncbi:TonB-dependent receptor plug domain-containing protein [Flavobacterium sp.]|uniref:TonB-dependent receptor plug domain-containing protein n=1 Tax=Flavobacterium sp. TaxID=239 RepID=UPI003F6963E2